MASCAINYTCSCTSLGAQSSLEKANQVPAQDGEMLTGATPPAATTYDLGKGEQLMIIRVYYDWPMLTGFVSNNFYTGKATGIADSENIKGRIIGGTVIFRNEPY